MRLHYYIAGCIMLLYTCVHTPSLFAQEPQLRQRNSQDNVGKDDWQGPRPTPPAPQQSTPIPAPQRPIRSRPQVLELPSAPQPTPVERPPQQTAPRAPAQPLVTRPTQLLTITVTDPQGRYVTGLTAEDFVIYEGEMQQPASYFNTGQKEPVSLGLLVDMSGSMLTKRTRARQALISFVRGIKPRDEVFLQTFSYRPELLQDFTDSRPLLLQAAAQLRPNGKTALYDAILDGLERVQRGQYGKKALIVMSDGLDTYSRASLEDTLKAIKNSGVLVYAIGIGSLRRHAQISTSPLGRSFIVGGGPPPLTIEGVDTHLLQTLSEETGAKHFFLDTNDVLSSEDALNQATETIAHELRQQYSLGYTSPVTDDVYRDVRVETRRKGLIVRTQKGKH